jgi:asparagine synthase (glutamine-hydrolysing)
MCGITGFSGKRDKGLLARMNQTLLPRGPDDQGFYGDGKMNLAMRRLSIVDVKGGSQPLSNEDATLWIVFNGEIYNHQPLRQDLIKKGHRFKTDHSDTEVIIHLYEEYADRWPLLVNGMFAAAIWDRRRSRLLLYRDRIGKKPLYYSLKNGQIIFGSEIKAVLKHPLVSAELDYNALYHYFGLKNISAPDTAYRARAFSGMAG